MVHSPDGFETGFGGRGPADLPLSLLAHFYGETQTEEEAQKLTAPKCRQAWLLHQDFKWAFIGPLKAKAGRFEQTGSRPGLRSSWTRPE